MSGNKATRRRQQGFILPGSSTITLGLAIALVLVIGGASLAIGILDGKLDRANAEAARLTGQLGEERQSRAQFQAASTACAKSVQRLEADSKAQERRYATQAAASRQTTAAAQRTAQAILASPRPPGADECQATRSELDAEIDRRTAPGR